MVFPDPDLPVRVKGIPGIASKEMFDNAFTALFPDTYDLERFVTFSIVLMLSS